MPDLLTEITQAAKTYYAQARPLPLTAADFHDWLASLPAPRQAQTAAQGFAASQSVPDFLRYCLELRGYDMWGHMAAQLSVEAFTLWSANGEFNGDLPPHAVAR